jgi:hypothetical protein
MRLERDLDPEEPGPDDQRLVVHAGLAPAPQGHETTMNEEIR